MNLRKAFREIAEGKKTVVIEDDEPDEAAELKARIFSDAWEGVEYYGPGAAEANARRAASLKREAESSAAGTTNETPAASHKPEKTARRRTTKRERLEAKAAKLRAEIERLNIKTSSVEK